MTKRKIEVFTAGCPCCEEAVQTLKGVVCESCDLAVLDMCDPEVAAKAKSYGVRSVPAVVVEGRLADCCGSGIDLARLRALGVGVAA